MFLVVALFAEPSDIKRFGVIIMVGMNKVSAVFSLAFKAAFFTGLGCQNALGYGLHGGVAASPLFYGVSSAINIEVVFFAELQLRSEFDSSSFKDSPHGLPGDSKLVGDITNGQACLIQNYGLVKVFAMCWHTVNISNCLTNVNP